MSSRPDTRKFPFVPTAHRRPEPRGGSGRSAATAERNVRRRLPATTPLAARRRRQSARALLLSVLRLGPCSSSVSRVAERSRGSRIRGVTTAVTAVARHHDSRRGRSPRAPRAGTRRRSPSAARRAEASSLSRARARAAAQNLSSAAAATTSARGAPHATGSARRTDARAAASPTRTPGRAHAGTSRSRRRPIPKIPFRVASLARRTPPPRGPRRGAARWRPKNAASDREARLERRLLSSVYRYRFLQPRTRTRSRRRARRSRRRAAPEPSRTRRRRKARFGPPSSASAPAARGANANAKGRDAFSARSRVTLSRVTLSPVTRTVKTLLSAASGPRSAGAEASRFLFFFWVEVALKRRAAAPASVHAETAATISAARAAHAKPGRRARPASWATAPWRRRRGVGLRGVRRQNRAQRARLRRERDAANAITPRNVSVPASSASSAPASASESTPASSARAAEAHAEATERRRVMSFSP